MKLNPVVVGIMIALVIGLVYFAFRAGQQSPQGTFSEGANAELERLREQYDEARERYDADLKELRAEFSQRVRELEQSVYGLREQLARAGVDIKPMTVRSGPGPRDSGAAPDQEAAGPISKDAFYQLRSNMSVQDVERILGRPGELSYRMGETDGTTTENYRWQWFNPDGSEGEVSVTFRNNKLEDKEFRGEGN